MKTHVPITHIMTSQVLSVTKETPLHEVERLMKKKHIRHMPVIQGKNIIGIVSLTDLERLSFAASFGEESDEDEVTVMSLLSLDQVMIRKPFSLQKNATVGDATQVLIRMDFHALPILDGEELIGIVTTTDLLKYFTGEYA